MSRELSDLYKRVPVARILTRITDRASGGAILAKDAKQIVEEEFQAIAADTAPAAPAESVVLERMAVVVNEGGGDTWVDDPEGEIVRADNAMAYAAQQREAGRAEAQLSAQPKAAPKMPDLTHVIRWLEGGCDPAQAARELRLYQRRMGQVEAPVPTCKQSLQAQCCNGNCNQGRDCPLRKGGA